jgi:hypothetical protein
MDPYLEPPVLWESIHARLIVAVANQLQPQLDPRYIASVEERVFIAGPQHRVPDVWIRKVRDAEEFSALDRGESDTAVTIEVEDVEIHESRVEILDSYSEMKLVALIEIVSPTNKAAGPGRESYRAKQEEILARECHLVEIDLLRKGRHVTCVPEWRVDVLKPFDFLCCVNRWPFRNRYELYPRKLRERLPRLKSRSPMKTPMSHWTCNPLWNKSTSKAGTDDESATISHASRHCHPKMRPGPTSKSRHSAQPERMSWHTKKVDDRPILADWHFQAWHAIRAPRVGERPPARDWRSA